MKQYILVLNSICYLIFTEYYNDYFVVHTYGCCVLY